MDDAGHAAGPNDLIVAFDLASPELGPQTLQWFRERLEAREQGLSAGPGLSPQVTGGGSQGSRRRRTWPLSRCRENTRPARRGRPSTLGLHVLMFSDNVPIEDEVSLKQYARNRGLFMMGPDCGTAVINGAPLGFANAVPRGRVGLVFRVGQRPATGHVSPGPSGGRRLSRSGSRRQRPIRTGKRTNDAGGVPGPGAGPGH